MWELLKVWFAAWMTCVTLAVILVGIGGIVAAVRLVQGDDLAHTLPIGIVAGVVSLGILYLGVCVIPRLTSRVVKPTYPDETDNGP